MLKQKYDEIVLGGGRKLPFLQLLRLSAQEPTNVENPQDDLARETRLYGLLMV